MDLNSTDAIVKAASRYQGDDLGLLRFFANLAIILGAAHARKDLSTPMSEHIKNAVRAEQRLAQNPQ